MQQQEIELSIKAKEGDREAFGSLYGTYVKKVYDFVYFRVRSKELAEDLVSDIFMKVLENMSKFDPQRGSFSAWIHRIARNKVIDHYRTFKEESSLDGVESGDGGKQANEAEDAMLMKQASSLLNRLKPEQRDIIVMRVWDELSYAEISAILGKSEAAAKMSFKRAVDNFRRIAPQDWLALLAMIAIIKN